MRYDLAFFLCCCKSFLGSSADGEDNFYEVLGIERDASPDEIKRAYKRQSLQMHPDKLAQRGQQVTEDDQARFQRMKEAYETLSDPHKKETYDAIGEKGMNWLEEPFSLDPQEMARNFANSSTLDRSKIFAIFVCIAAAVFMLPIFICLQVDGKLGSTKWVSVLTPLWIWDAFILLYHARVILLGSINKPENIPDSEWVDPLPMSKRVLSLVRFSLVILFEVFAAMKLDDTIDLKWSKIFVPIYLWEASTLYKKLPIARMRIVTVEDLETALGKPYTEFTDAEKELISKRYSVVPSLDSPEFEAAHKFKSRARQDVIKVMFRGIFLVVLIIQLDSQADWNWWFIFTPFWLMSFCICCGSYQSFAEAQGALAEKDPELFSSGTVGEDENQNYGAMGTSNISQEEKEELKAQLLQAGYRMITSCCSQAFVLIIVCLFVGKLQGAGYSSILIISPLLFIAISILLCLGCTIFCITDVSAEEVANTAGDNLSSRHGSGQDYTPPNVAGTDSVTSGPVSTWDPEKGEVWADPNTPISKPDQPASAITIIPAPPSEHGTDTAATSMPVDLINAEATQNASQTQPEHPSSAIDELD